MDDAALLNLARRVVRFSNIPYRHTDDAVGEAALAGWVALSRYNPDGGATEETYLKACMRYRLIDWTRRELGKQGRRAAIRNAGCLDDTAQTDPHLKRVEDIATARRLLAHPTLTERERDAVRSYVTGETVVAAGRRWGTSGVRVSQVRHAAFRKMLAAAA